LGEQKNVSSIIYQLQGLTTSHLVLSMHGSSDYTRQIEGKIIIM